MLLNIFVHMILLLFRMPTFELYYLCSCIYLTMNICMGNCTSIHHMHTCARREARVELEQWYVPLYLGTKNAKLLRKRWLCFLIGGRLLRMVFIIYIFVFVLKITHVHVYSMHMHQCITVIVLNIYVFTYVSPLLY